MPSGLISGPLAHSRGSVLDAPGRGHALTDVVEGFDDIRDAVRDVARMSHKLDVFMQQHQEEIRSMQDFSRQILSEMKTLVEHIVGGDIVKCCGWARSGGVFLNHQSILENLSL